jgi:hypothetical protein
MRYQKPRDHTQGLLLVIVILTLVYASSSLGLADALQGTKIALSFSNDRPLRGEVLKVSGRLSTVEGDMPIPLVKVRLDYHRLGEADLVRELTTITSNPGGIFEDLINTTYLLRIGTWVVNATFSSQLGYQSTFTAMSFTVVVQPALSLYVSTHNFVIGRNVTFNGLLFACIPCIHDNVTVILSRPDNTSIVMIVPVNATGGPYPGGYYSGIFFPDTPGRWAVRTVWKGNDVTLPAYSQVEEVNVEPANASLASPLCIAVSMTAVAGVVLFLFYRGKRARKEKEEEVVAQ